MQYVSLFEALAAEDMYPNDLFVVRASSNRERIQSWGLGAAVSGQDDTPVEHPSGLYAFTDLSSAMSYAGENYQDPSTGVVTPPDEMRDIWKIPANTIPNNLISDWSQVMINTVVININHIPNVELLSPYEDRQIWPGESEPVQQTEAEAEINRGGGAGQYYDLGNPDPVNKPTNYKKFFEGVGL